MSDEIRPQANPIELWRQWYDTVFGAWANPPGGRTEEGTDGTTNPFETWRRWTEATAETWLKAAEVGARMSSLAVPRWAEVAEEVLREMLGGAPPVDPLDLYTRLYNAASGPLSALADDVLRDEAFLDFSRRSLDYYTVFDGVFRRVSEQYVSNLELPTSSDVHRVAELVVALDDKVDRVEEVLEDFEHGYKEFATAEAVRALGERLERVEGRLEQLDRVESKLDRLLADHDAADDAAAGKPPGLDPSQTEHAGEGKDA